VDQVLNTDDVELAQSLKKDIANSVR
jgi:hypothetical protein